MPDNINVVEGTGGGVVPVSADDIGGVRVQRVKIQQGVDGEATDVSVDTPLHIQLTNLEKAEDSAHVSGDDGVMLLAVRANTATATGADGDYVPLLTDTNGRLHVIEPSAATRLTESDFDTKVGALTETAPATDTASSGLNGRLQRIAQRITSLIALIPTALTGSGNFKVAVQEALPAGTANIGDVDVLTLPTLPAGDNNIGNVDIVTLPALPAGTNAIGKLAANSGVDIGDVDVATMPDLRESWRVSLQSFTTTNDSDNTFTVPANTEWRILGIYILYAATATAGNRKIAVQCLDSSDNIICDVRAGVIQPESTSYTYQIAPGMLQDVSIRDDYSSVAFPTVWLAAGQKLRVYDKAAIAAAADDMVVRVQVASRSIA